MITRSNAWFARVKAGVVHFYSFDALPDASDSEIEEFLDNFTEDVRERELITIAGDVNAWATN